MTQRLRKSLLKFQLHLAQEDVIGCIDRSYLDEDIFVQTVKRFYLDLQGNLLNLLLETWSLLFFLRSRSTDDTTVNYRDSFSVNVNRLHLLSDKIFFNHSQNDVHQTDFAETLFVSLTVFVILVLFYRLLLSHRVNQFVLLCGAVRFSWLEKVNLKYRTVDSLIKGVAFRHIKDARKRVIVQQYHLVNN